MKFDVVSFGSAVIDVFIGTDVCEEKNFISYPIGGKILIKDLKFDIGGGGTNTAVAFSRLGFKTGCICKVGHDENGRKIREALGKEKISFLGKSIERELTGYSIILDSKGGDRTILTYKGANDKIKFEDIVSFKTKWLYFSSLLGTSFETQKKLASIMKKRGTKIAFNPSSYLIKNKNIFPILKMTDVLILNKEEAEMLLRHKEKDLLKGLYNLTGGIVVITDKDKLITCYDGEKKYSLKPNNVKVVERTGAGDAFASGFVAGRIVKKSIKECLKLGLRESESVIRYFGAKNNLLRFKLK
ncbi:MAG: carbohydrate kinase family protein [archaeon]